jgi:tRNA pseudouridine38-40 synthase
VSPSPLGGGTDDPSVDRSVRWRLTVAYDGAAFHGFAAQEGQRTVAGALGAALARISRTPVALTCAGRTDAGVHATAQVVHFDLPAERSDGLDPASLVRSCNRLLGPSVVVGQAAVVPAAFDARRSAIARRYRYLVVNAPVPDPLLAGLTWQVADPLDLRTMEAASDALLGEHDFRAFCRRVPGSNAEDPITRRVTDARWARLGGLPDPGAVGLRERRSCGTLLPWVGDLLAFEIEANAFCHQMVRSLVGTLVDVGRGRKRASDMLAILRSADRQQASQPAPPQGLTLVAVRYDTP